MTTQKPWWEEASSRSTSSEGKTYEQTAWGEAATRRFASSLNINNPSIPSIATPPIQPLSNTKSSNRKGKEDGGTPPNPPEQKSNLFKSLLSSISEKGLWEDYSGEDRSFRTKGSDGKVKYDWGAGLQNTFGNISKYGAMAMSFIKDKETANNTVNDAATSVRKTALLALMSTGNPIAMAIGAGSMLSDKVGGTASATKGLGTVNDVGNFVASQVPFLGFAGASMGKQFQSDELAGSSMYTWNSTADGLFGGKVLFGRGKAKDLTQTNNMQRSLATNILKDAKLDFIGAQDPRYYIAAQNKLNGGYDLVGRAKQGAILQFTKRTLSKHKIKKLQGGGLISTTSLPKWLFYDEDKNEYVSDFYESSPKESVLELNKYVKENLPGWKVWKSPSGQKRYFILTEKEANARDTKIAEQIAKEALKGSTGKIKPLIGETIGIDSKQLKYIGDQVGSNGNPINFVDELGNGYYFPEYKEGGKVNVIPEGALHKNKHHLEEVDEKFEDVTTKGIPVIVESKEGEVIQLAEVEREEIIFRLEVTKKLEELSKKHTDEAAIEAGKLLVKEILYNTEDNTGKMI